MKKNAIYSRYHCIKTGILVTGLALMLLFSGCALIESSLNGSPAKKLQITEIVSANKLSLVDPDVGSPDWFEIFNPSDVDVDVSGYGLSDNMRNFHKYVLPEGTIVPARGFLIVYAGENNGIRATTVPCTGFGLSRSGDYLFFTDPYYNLLQQIQIPSMITDVSYAMRSDGSFGYCAEPTPGKQNDDSKIVDSIDLLAETKDYTKLVLSEVMPGTAEDGPWVELYNRADTPARLEDYALSDSDTNLLRYIMPPGTIEPHGYAIVYMSGEQDGSHELETSFKLSKNDTTVYLSSAEGTLLSSISWEKGLPAGVSVVSENGTAMYTANPTKAAPNSTDVFDSVGGGNMDDSDPVRINEVLQRNKYSVIDCDGDRSEWVELKNHSSREISLKGYFLSDNENNLFKYALPDVHIPANGFIVIFLSGKDKQAGSEIHTDFRLGTGEEALYLTAVSGLRTDRLPLMQVKKDNVSVGPDLNGQIRYFAQPTPGAENTAKGFEKAEDIGFFNSRGVIFSEVCAKHEIKSGENDWFELYNGGDAAVDLSGWHVTTDYDEPEMYTFPAGTVIGAGAYLAVDTTTHVLRQSEGVGTFGISASGETLYLLDPDGNRIDVFETGVLKPGITSGRQEGEESGVRVFYRKPTKGAPNSDSYAVGYSAMPVFSETALYQTEPILVSIRAPEGATVYYTTNGQDPSTKANLYTGSINVSGNMVLRAISYTEGLLPSEIATCTYVFDEPHTIPVVTVTLNPDDFKKVSSADKSNKPERKALVSYYESNGSIGVTFPCGLKAKGQGTLGYRQKSFSLNLRGGYGQSTVTYPFFENCEFDTFSALVIRNSGQDIEEARMRDSLFSRLMKGMNVDYEETRPVAVYINGQYWGLYDFDEKLNSAYLQTHTGVSSDLVDYVQRNETTLKGSKEGYLNARSWGRNKNLKDDAVFAEYAKLIDVDYCTDYIIAQTFIINSDMFNQKFWHTKDNTVRWRPVLFDLDWGLNEESSVKRSLLPAYFSVEGIPSHNGSLTNLDVFVGLKKNAAWQRQFTERYVELLCTHLNPERCLAIFDELYDEMKDEMPRHIERWGYHKSMSSWEKHVKLLRDKLADRPAAALQNLKEYAKKQFKISSSEIDDMVAKYSG